MSVGVIGGADGPTTILVAGEPWLAVAAAVLAVALGLGAFLRHRRKR